ncbi:MAG: c-type cytochrome biogenesis protein CcsB [Desulfocapsaceae bacterium]|nr:c-type cytochrome biogenesis protein CcsB [Desulfocapsaceae bacterium]
MNSAQFLGITTFAYMFSTLLYVAMFVFKIKRLGKFTTCFTAIALLVQTAGLGLRWQESYQMGIGHAPLTNMYESVIFFAWAIIVLYLLIEWKFKTQIIGAFAVPFAFLAMAYASLSKDLTKGISPLIPALQSNWLISHVITCFIGYAAFTVAAGLGLMYLIKETSDSRHSSNDKTLIGSLLPLHQIEDITHKTMIFGFIWLTAGIITGAVWADSAWGTYWSWDPKETWSLITWFVYAITLHARYTRGWGGKRIAWLAIIGFFSVIFTYYGVNFILSGLHSYGSN